MAEHYRGPYCIVKLKDTSARSYSLKGTESQIETWIKNGEGVEDMLGREVHISWDEIRTLTELQAD